MRVLVATGIAVSLAALAAGAQAREVSIYRGKCGVHVLPRAPAGLPAPAQIETRCGVFQVEPSGRVAQVRRLRPHDPAIRLKRPQGVVIHDVEKGIKMVYMLRSHERSPTPLYSHRSRFGLSLGLCEGMGVDGLGRRGNWLLYASGEGHLVAIESRSRRVFNLTRLLRQLPGGRRTPKGRVFAIATWA